MRRPLAALLAGTALMATAIVPAAAGADPAPFKDKHPRTKARLHLTCRATRQGDKPAVTCTWEQRPADRPMPAGVRYRLWRLGKAEHRHVKVIYRGRATSFVDTGVRPGRGYLYRVQVVDPDGETVGRSNVAAVRVRRAQPESVEPPCQDRFSTASRIPTTPDECDQPDTASDPTPKPTHPDKPETPAGPPSADEPKGLPGPKSDMPGDKADKPSEEPADKPAPGKPADKPAPGKADKPADKPSGKPDRPASDEADRPGKPAHPGKPAADEEKAQDRPASKAADRPSAGPRPDRGPVDQMRLACEPMPDADPVAVKCSWTPVEGAAGYRLWRAERGDLKMAFDTKDTTSYVDQDVESGHGYLYLVQALDADGGVIGRSHPVQITLRPAGAKREAHQGS